MIEIKKCVRIGLAAGLFALAGCESHLTATRAPSGFTVSAPVDEYIREEYMTEPGAGYLVVSADGEWVNMSYCPGGFRSCLPGTTILIRVLEICHQETGQKCFVLGEGRRVIEYTVRPWADPDGPPVRGPEAPA